MRRLLLALLTASALTAGCADATDDAAPAAPAASSPASEAAPSGPAAATSATSDARIIAISVAGGEVRRESRRVEVRRGEKVRIEVTADVTDEVHLHTYDVRADVAPGQPAALDFTATIPGQFDVELEESHLLLVVIAVR